MNKRELDLGVTELETLDAPWVVVIIVIVT